MKKHKNEVYWVLRGESVSGIAFSFIFMASVACLFYFSPELYFKFYGVHTSISGRYHFFGMLIFVVGCWILYLDVSVYIIKKNKQKNEKQRLHIANVYMENEIEERLENQNN
ncbi:hypothetical protein ACFQ1T_00770 [Methylophilus glucosoxydans]|uniref:Uncharacterized protein n=1 Tax=Methylophilus glucosoxydans TaxID=752553 RepID=A0ABW3GCJ4_9PROT